MKNTMKNEMQTKKTAAFDALDHALNRIFDLSFQDEDTAQELAKHLRTDNYLKDAQHLLSTALELARPSSERRNLGLMAGLARVQDRNVISLFDLLNCMNDLCSDIHDSPEVPGDIKSKCNIIALSLRPVIREVNSEIYDRLQDYRNEITNLKEKPRTHEPSKS